MLSIIAPGIRVDVTSGDMIEVARKILYDIMAQIRANQDKSGDIITIHNDTTTLAELSYKKATREWNMKRKNYRNMADVCNDAKDMMDLAFHETEE